MRDRVYVYEGKREREREREERDLVSFSLWDNKERDLTK